MKDFIRANLLVYIPNSVVLATVKLSEIKDASAIVLTTLSIVYTSLLIIAALKKGKQND